jgi:hypothetical protein
VTIPPRNETATYDEVDCGVLLEPESVVGTSEEAVGAAAGESVAVGPTVPVKGPPLQQ